jgi:hypothetical protein
MQLPLAGLLGALVVVGCRGLLVDAPQIEILRPDAGPPPLDAGSPPADARPDTPHGVPCVPGANTGFGSGSGSGAPPIAGTCDDAMGPRRDYSSPSELYGLMLGRWQLCSGVAYPGGSAGIEFGEDGAYYALIPDGSGKLVRGSGSSSGQWVACDDLGVTLLDLFPTPSTVAGDVPLLEDTPRRLAIDIPSDGQPSIYVWIGP